WRSMKTGTPHSVPDGDSSSLGMIVSAAVAEKATSCGVRMIQDWGASAGAAAVLVSVLQAVSPVAIAAPVAPAAHAAFRKSRRGSLTSAMGALPAGPPARSRGAFSGRDINPNPACERGEGAIEIPGFPGIVPSVAKL